MTHKHKKKNYIKKKKKKTSNKKKGEKERYSHLNAEFQRTARKDKKAFLSEQCKEIKETSSMGKLDNSSRQCDAKGTFYAKMFSIKCRNGMDLKE